MSSRSSGRDSGVQPNAEAMPTSRNPVSGRRWIRFSLRGLFLLVLVLAVSLGWTVDKVRQQAIAVAALTKMGCTVDCADSPSGSAAVLERLRALAGQDEISAVISVNGNMSQVDDAGLAHLHGVPYIANLHLGGTRVTDAGLEHLRGLTSLAFVTLAGTRITDRGLEQLRGLIHLRALDIRHTQFTDAGLKPLQGLMMLQVLALDGTRVTDDGVQRLQKALPNCKIQWQQ